jgi:hypothetical protein
MSDASAVSRGKPRLGGPWPIHRLVVSVKAAAARLSCVPATDASVSASAKTGSGA